MKIKLRRFHSKDFYKLTAIIDKDTAIKAGLAWPFDRESAMSFITDYNTWGIYHSEVLLGAIEIRSNLETAYLVGKQWRGKGIATEAVKLIKEKFADKQLWCLIKPENRASLRVAQKAAMRITYYNG